MMIYAPLECLIFILIVIKLVNSVFLVRGEFMSPSSEHILSLIGNIKDYVYENMYQIMNLHHESLNYRNI